MIKKPMSTLKNKSLSLNLSQFLISIQKQPFADVLQDRCSQKFCKTHRKTPVPDFLFCRSEACNPIKKEFLTQVFSCEFCEIFKNTFFTEHLLTTAFLIGQA